MLLYAIQNLPASAGIFISVLMVLCSVLAHYILTRPAKPVSVNYHFTRKCNKTCGFCFHTEKTSHVATWEEIQRGLDLPKEAGMKKINFAGQSNGASRSWRPANDSLCRRRTIPLSQTTS